MNMPLPGNVPSQHQERLTDYRVPSEESPEAPLPKDGKNRHPSDLLKPPWVIQSCFMNLKVCNYEIEIQRISSQILLLWNHFNSSLVVN